MDQNLRTFLSKLGSTTGPTKSRGNSAYYSDLAKRRHAVAMPKTPGTLGSQERPFSQLDENFQKAVWETVQKCLKEIGQDKNILRVGKGAGFFKPKTGRRVQVTIDVSIL